VPGFETEQGPDTRIPWYNLTLAYEFPYRFVARMVAPLYQGQHEHGHRKLKCSYDNQVPPFRYQREHHDEPTQTDLDFAGDGFAARHDRSG
jgi:hypothetical protein